MRSVFLWIVVVTLLPALPAAGQHTIDPGTPPPDSLRRPRNEGDSTHHTDTTRWHYTYVGTGTINNTNNLHSYVISNSLRLSLAEKLKEFNFTNSWVYGKQNYVLTNNDFTSTLDMAWYKTLRHFYYWGMATYNHSVPLMINHQGQAGLGPGYNVIDKKKATLSLTDGLLFEVADLYDSLYGQPGGNIFRRDRYNAVRNSAHLFLHWVINDQYTIEGSGFLQNRLADWSDYILRLTGNASVRLYKWVIFTASVAYGRFTRTRGQNTLFSFGLTVTR